jgi:hypothetical protein
LAFNIVHQGDFKTCRFLFIGRSRDLLEFPESRVSGDGTFSSSAQDDAANFISDIAQLLQFNNPLVGDQDYEPPIKRSRIEQKPEDITSSLLYAGKTALYDHQTKSGHLQHLKMGISAACLRRIS